MGKFREQQPLSPSTEPAAPAAVAAAPVVQQEKPPTPAQVAAASVPPKDELPRWRVSWGEKSDVIRAANKPEAWALFCDAMKTWPSPKTGKIEAL